MDVVANGPFRFAQLRWVLSAGAPAITVVCKATFVLQPIEAPLAAEQEAPVEEDSYWNDDPEKSLSAATDLVPFKKQPEVVLVGHAFAPRQQPVRSLVARLLVGNVNKAIEVYGERAFALDGQLDDGTTFQKMRLSYERAAGGGPDSVNPVGIRFDVQDAYGRTRLPNLQPPGSFVARRGDLFAPIGFGPIAQHWSERRARFHRMAASFATRAWTERPFPEGVDAGCFNVAPLDQRLETLHPNERITLENLHPDHPRLTTSLPGLEVQGIVERPGQPPQKLVLACDTLWIDTDRQLCHLVWRGTVALTRPDESGRIVLSAAGRAAVRAELAHFAGLPTTEDPSSTTIAPFMIAGGAAPTLPFAMSTKEEPRSGGPRRGGGALPFNELGGHAPKPPAAPPAVYPVVGDPSEGTLFLDSATTATLPTLTDSPGAGQSGASAPPPLAAPPPPAVQPVILGAPGAAFGASAPPTPVLGAPSAEDRSPWAGGGLSPSVSAISGGALSAVSLANALAVEMAVAAGGSGATDPVESQVAPRRHVISAPSTLEEGEIVELLWFDPKSPARIRTRWPVLMNDLAFEPLDPRHDLPAEDPEDARDRHDVFGVLTEGEAQTGGSIGQAVREAVSAKGRFTPPLILVAGELRFPFDEIETLKAVVAVVSPMATSDKRLKELLDAAGEILATAYLQSSTGVVDRLTNQIKEQAGQANRGIAASQIESNVERVLLQQRKYQVRRVFGEECIRAQLAASSAKESPVPVYLPKSLQDALPMYPGLKARIIGEACLRQDQYEATAFAIRAVALGRVSRINV